MGGAAAAMKIEDPDASYVPVVVGDKVVQSDVDAHSIAVATMLVGMYLCKGGTARMFHIQIFCGSGRPRP